MRIDRALFGRLILPKDKAERERLIAGLELTQNVYTAVVAHQMEVLNALAKGKYGPAGEALAEMAWRSE